MTIAIELLEDGLHNNTCLMKQKKTINIDVAVSIQTLLLFR